MLTSYEIFLYLLLFLMVSHFKSLFFIRSCYLPSFTKVVLIRERGGSSSYSPSFNFGPIETKNPIHGDLNPGCAMLFYRSLLQLSKKHSRRGQLNLLQYILTFDWKLYAVPSFNQMLLIWCRTFICLNWASYIYIYFFFYFCSTFFAVTLILSYVALVSM